MKSFIIATVHFYFLYFILHFACHFFAFCVSRNNGITVPICRKMGDETIEIFFILRYLLCFRVNIAIFMPAKIFERVLRGF